MEHENKLMRYALFIVSLICATVLVGALVLTAFGFSNKSTNSSSGYLFALVVVFLTTALTKIIPKSAERATYVLISGVTSVILIGYWMMVPGQVWNLANPIFVYALWGIFVFGWVFLLAATFAIDHFDLFGLRQVYANFKSRPLPPLHFVKRFMYKYIRHPIQTGVLIGVWATPSMSRTQIVLSIGFTAYIFIGLWFEERDLIREHGDDYLAYRASAGKLLPKFGGG